MNSLMQVPVLNSLKREMDRIFDRVWDTDLDTPSMGDWLPALDLSETDESVMVRMEVPGIEPKDIHVNLSGRTLTIRGDKKHDAEWQDERLYRTERSWGSFARSIQLPSPVDEGKVNATFKNGLLIVTLNKAVEAKGTNIPVRAA
jgi:HSP20 family protein